MVAVPLVEWIRPSSIRSVVVLPAPLGPRKPVIRPGSTSKLRSSTATKEPKRLVSPRISIFAPVAVVVLMGYLVVSCPDPCSPTWREGQPPGGPGSPSRWTRDDRERPGSPYDGPIMTPWLLLLLGVVLTVGTALFVAAEFSLVALDRPAVQRAVDAGEPGARSVLTSHRRLSTQLSACQLGITLTTLVLGFIASPSIGALLLGPLESLGLSESAASSTASVLAMLIATVFSMIVGEMVPKTLAVSLPLATAKVAAAPVRWFGIAMKPMILLLNGVANRTLLALGIEPQEELSAARSPAELASLVRTSAEAGTLDRSTARLVTASLGFSNQTAADVMTPRSRATSIERTSTAADVVSLARRTGHSRFPVVGADWDDIDGIVHVKKAIAVPFDRRRDVPVSALMVPAVLVPETLRLDPLLAPAAPGRHAARGGDRRVRRHVGRGHPRGPRRGDRRRGQRRARPFADHRTQAA